MSAVSWDSNNLLRILKDHYGDVSHEMCGAEIGVHEGWLSAQLLRKFPRLWLYMIDPWINHADDSVYAKTKDELSVLTAEQHNACLLRALELTDFAKDRRTIVRMMSTDAAKNIAVNQLDWVFIDACHAYESTKEDIATWWPLIKSGGLLTGHDYMHTNPLYGVKRAVDEFAEETRLPFRAIDNCWWFVKP